MTGEAVRVWSFLRCDRAYRAQWRDRAAPPEYADGPFPVRVQSEADGRGRVGHRGAEAA